jgi:hypothetical protein
LLETPRGDLPQRPGLPLPQLFLTQNRLASSPGQLHTLPRRARMLTSARSGGPSSEIAWTS